MEQPCVRRIRVRTEVLDIRKRLATTVLAQRAFGGEEPLYPDRVSGAVARQTTGYGRRRKYTRPEQIAATLFYGLCMDHGFANGNKRTALVAMLVLLDKNGFVLTDTSEEDLYSMATRTASHDLDVAGVDGEVEAIAVWLDQRIRKKDTDWRKKRFRDFRHSLKLGCAFDAPSNNYVKIRREVDGRQLSVRTGYPNDHFVVPLGESRKIRRVLKLDEEHGFDAGSIYDLAGSFGKAFVLRYQGLIDRLADM